MELLDAILELLRDGMPRKAIDIFREFKRDMPLVNEALAFLAVA